MEQPAIYRANPGQAPDSDSFNNMAIAVLKLVAEVNSLRAELDELRGAKSAPRVAAKATPSKE